MPAFSYPTTVPALQNEGSAIVNITETLRTQFAVAGTPLGSMTQLGMIAAGVAEALSGVSVQQQIDVRQFGQWQDGINCTATLIAALQAAGTNTVGGTPYPLGVVMPTLPDPLGGVLMSAGIGGAPIQIPTGVSLRGSGWKTHLTVDPASMTTPGANYHVLDCIGAGGQNIIADFQLDGNKANINGGLIGQVGNIGLYIDSNTGAVNDVIMSNLYVHDFYNQPAGESFGIFIGSTAAGVGQRVLVVGCRSYNHGGSGFSVSGPGQTPPQGSTIDVIYANCYGYNNSFQGFTSFQSQYNSYIGCYATGNSRAGFNVEWSDNVKAVGCTAHGNGLNGYRVLGASSNIHFASCSSYGNNTGLLGQVGEFDVSQSLDGVVAGAPKNVWITGCHCVPLSGSNHLSTGQPNLNSTSGNISFATADEANTPFTGIFVDGPDVHKWIYTLNGSSDSRYSAIGLSIKAGGVGVASGHPSTWTLTNITVSAAAAGSLSINNTNTAKTFTQTAANTTTSAVSVTTFAPGRRIIIHCRLKLIDFNANWNLELNSLSKRLRIPVTGGANDLGSWLEADFIATIPSNFGANTLNLQTIVNTASASAIGVDYVTVKLLPYLGAESGS